MYFIPQNTTLTFATAELCGIRELIKGHATAAPQVQSRAHSSLRLIWQTHGCPPSPSSTTTNNSNMDTVGTCMMAETFTKLDGVAMSALLITRCNYSKSIVIKQHLTKHLICMACSCNLNELAKNKARIIDALKVPHTLLRSQPEVKTLNSQPPGLQWSGTATLAPPWQSPPIHTLGVLQVRKFSPEDLTNPHDNFHAKMVDQAVQLPDGPGPPLAKHDLWASHNNGFHSPHLHHLLLIELSGCLQPLAPVQQYGTAVQEPTLEV